MYIIYQGNLQFVCIWMKQGKVSIVVTVTETRETGSHSVCVCTHVHAHMCMCMHKYLHQLSIIVRNQMSAVTSEF